MKIILKNEQEIEVTRLSEMLDENNRSLSINMATDDSIDNVKALLEGNTGKITVHRYGKDVVFEGYESINSIMRDITDQNDNVHITLNKAGAAE